MSSAPAFANISAPAGLSAYVRARAADSAGEGAAALAAYRDALVATPDSALVAIRAYRAALIAGDGALARRAAAVLSRAGVAPLDAALLPLADAARADDAAAALRALDALAGDRLRILVAPSRGWIAASRGQDGAAAVDGATDATGRRLANEARALLLIAAGRVHEGVAAAAALGGTIARPSGFRIAAAELLVGGGHVDEARRLLGDDDAALAVARAGATVRPGLAFGVSRLLLRVADDLSDETTSPLAIALARAALDADPGYARARFVLADQLARADEVARGLAELDGVPAGPLTPAVAVQRIEILNRADRLPEAIAAARGLAVAPDATVRDRARYADLLFGDGRPAEALPLYRRVLADRAVRDSWSAWLRYGGALDEAGRWGDARKALRRAAKLGPDEPSVLNYLGYTLVDRREDIGGGTAMLERAHALAPDDAAVADSLGWAYHLTGDTARALPLVEGAAAELPTDPEVADHLGDIYWSLGRRYEARYAWRAAQLTATPRDRVRITMKLDAGPREQTP